MLSHCFFFSVKRCFTAGHRPTRNGYCCCFHRHRHSYRHSNDCCCRQSYRRCCSFHSNVCCYRRYNHSNDCCPPNSFHPTNDCYRSCWNDYSPNNFHWSCRACCRSLYRPSKNRNRVSCVSYACCCYGLNCPNTDHSLNGCFPKNGCFRNCPSDCCLHTHHPNVRNGLNDSASLNSGLTDRCCASMSFGRKNTCLRMTRNAMRRFRRVRMKKYGSWSSGCCLQSSDRTHSSVPNCNNYLCNRDNNGNGNSSNTHRNTLRTTDHTTGRTSRHKNHPSPSRSSSPNKDVSIATNMANSKSTDHTMNTSYPIRCRCLY